MVRLPDEAFGVFQALFTLGVDLHFRPKHVVDHGGHQSSGKEIGHEHGEGDGEGERGEEEAGRAGEQQHGDKHDADGKRGDEGGQRDLLGAIENGAGEHLAIPMLRWTFSISTVASSTRMPTASAMPPRVMTLMVWPMAQRTMQEVRIESGMEVQTMTVLRQLPRKSRIMMAVRPAAIRPSRTLH